MRGDRAGILAGSEPNAAVISKPHPTPRNLKTLMTLALGAGADLSARGTMDPVLARLPQSYATLPVLRIDTKDAAPIVSKETYVAATFALTNPAVGPDALPLNGKIRGRGNSTWGLPKNPYKVQFTDDAIKQVDTQADQKEQEILQV